LTRLIQSPKLPPGTLRYPEAETVGNLLHTIKKAYLLKCSLEDVIGEDISVEINITYSEYLSLLSSISPSKNSSYYIQPNLTLKKKLRLPPEYITVFRMMPRIKRNYFLKHYTLHGICNGGRLCRL
jgi:hypothetical protein